MWMPWKRTWVLWSQRFRFRRRCRNMPPHRRNWRRGMRFFRRWWFMASWIMRMAAYLFRIKNWWIAFRIWSGGSRLWAMSIVWQGNRAGCFWLRKPVTPKRWRRFCSMSIIRRVPCWYTVTSQNWLWWLNGRICRLLIIIELSGRIKPVWGMWIIFFIRSGGMMMQLL